jgi:hypothetical protein
MLLYPRRYLEDSLFERRIRKGLTLKKNETSGRVMEGREGGTGGC